MGRLVGSEMNAIFRRLSNFLRHALDREWRDQLEETSPAFGLADLISTRWGRIGRVRLFLITNRELSERVDGRAARSMTAERLPTVCGIYDDSTDKRRSGTVERISRSISRKILVPSPYSPRISLKRTMSPT